MSWLEAGHQLQLIRIYIQSNMQYLKDEDEDESCSDCSCWRRRNKIHPSWVYIDDARSAHHAQMLRRQITCRFNNSTVSSAALSSRAWPRCVEWCIVKSSRPAHAHPPHTHHTRTHAHTPRHAHSASLRIHRLTSPLSSLHSWLQVVYGSVQVADSVENWRFMNRYALWICIYTPYVCASVKHCCCARI